MIHRAFPLNHLQLHDDRSVGRNSPREDTADKTAPSNQLSDSHEYTCRDSGDILRRSVGCALVCGEL
jgi:hypothetical protein